MRIGCLTNDKPLFVYEAVSISDYDWDSKTTFQKFISYLLIAFFFIGFGYVALVISTNHLIIWADLGWPLFWAILKCLIIVALFPAIIFPMMFLFQSAETSSPPQHEFFQDWACVYTGIGRSVYTSFSARDVEHMRLERVVYRDQPLFLVTVQLKPCNFPPLRRPGNERFGLPLNTEAELKPFRDWAMSNQIQITQDPVTEFQRRS